MNNSAPPPPQYVAPPPDPLFQQLNQQAQRDNMRALSEQAAGDTADFMMRYGTAQALGNGGGGTAGPAIAPLSAAAPAPLPSLGFLGDLGPILAQRVA